MTPTDEKPMTVDALIENTRLAWYLGQRYWQQADSESYADNKRSALTLEKFNKLLESSRAAIEQYGREQGFESTAQRDVREACCELRDALGNPVISGTGDQTLQGQTIRMAAAKLREAAGRGSEPIAMLHDDGHWTHPPGRDPLDRFSGKVRMDVYAAPQPSETLTEAQECAAVVFATKMHVERRTNAHADICDDMGEIYATCSWSLDAGLRAEALRDLVNEAIERAHDIRSEG